MSTGYSGTPLTRKLGYKPGNKVLWIDVPNHYTGLLTDLPVDLILGEWEEKEFDFIHLFSLSTEHLESYLPSLPGKLKKSGMLWVSWPKGKSKIVTDLNENIVRTLGLACGLVDTKVAAIDEDWSGLKFMYRIKDR